MSATIAAVFTTLGAANFDNVDLVVSTAVAHGWVAIPVHYQGALCGYDFHSNGALVAFIDPWGGGAGITIMPASQL